MNKRRWIIVALIFVAALLYFLNRYLNAPLVTEQSIKEMRLDVSQQREMWASHAESDTTEYPAPSPNKNVYFGDLHVHSSLSFDSYLFGNRFSLDDAYKFARGEKLTSRTGEVMSLSRPLDFAAITDHAEGFGMHELCSAQNLPTGAGEFCQQIEKPSFKLFMKLRQDATKRPPESLLGQLMDDSTKVNAYASAAWQQVVSAADQYNAPGKFTTFAAYEYSPPLPDRGKIHRNVIFQNTSVPAFVPSAFEAKTELDLWSQLDVSCKEPCSYLTIPHNPNKSWGLAFASHTIDGDPYTTKDWKRRSEVEPLVEMFQIKGNSECSLGVGTTDEECGYEQFLPRCEDGEKTNCIFPTSMVRDGLKKGLALEDTLGLNPLQFGLIGSTDTHNSNPGDTEEWDFRGSSGFLSGSASYRVNGAPSLPKKNIAQTTTGGLAAIWAEENTRDALFAAMQRKEVYATSGTRIGLRFFASFNDWSNLEISNSSIQTAYQEGVPMGSTLTTPAEGSPTFLVVALKDPLSAPLDKIQIIKAWTANGESHEKVIDAACSNGREPNPETDRCAPTQATVNITNCAYDSTLGASQLSALWKDESYSPTQNALYYARIIENPTCRYSTYDSLRIGQQPRKDIPATTTEMAWSSPIWIKSNPSRTD